MLLTVWFFSSQMDSVGLPFTRHPIVICRRISPCLLYAAEIDTTPHMVIPIWPATGHHLNHFPLPSGIPLPIIIASAVPTRRSWSTVLFSLLASVTIPSILPSAFTNPKKSISSSRHGSFPGQHFICISFTMSTSSPRTISLVRFLSIAHRLTWRSRIHTALSFSWSHPCVIGSHFATRPPRSIRDRGAACIIATVLAMTSSLSPLLLPWACQSFMIGPWGVGKLKTTVIFSITSI